MAEQNRHSLVAAIEQWIERAEGAIYVVTAGLMVFLAGAILCLAVYRFGTNFAETGAVQQSIVMLDHLLLVLMIAELLYTVRVSIRTHSLLPEPFLIVGLIAAMRRVLVITAETWKLDEVEPAQFNRAMIELGVLTALTIVLVVSIIILHRYRRDDYELETGERSQEHPREQERDSNHQE